MLILRLNYEEPQCTQFTDIIAHYSSSNHPKVVRKRAYQPATYTDLTVVGSRVGELIDFFFSVIHNFAATYYFDCIVVGNMSLSLSSLIH